MRITTAAFLDDSGQPLDTGPGVDLLRQQLGLTLRDLAGLCGVSTRTAEGWSQGRPPGAAALNAMARLLTQKRVKPLPRP